MTDTSINIALKKADQGKVLTRVDIRNLLSLSDRTDPKSLARLFSIARATRQDHFGNKIFLYGFLYFSTHCRNNCQFCQYRRDNTDLPRYRKSLDEIICAGKEMARTGVHLIDLTMGEDPELFASGEPGFKQLVDMTKAVQEETGLPVMISPGTVPDNILEELADIGVTWYACYQETHNKTLYEALRKGQGFKKRLAKKELAKRLGMLIEEGLLTGVGESLDDLADSILWMKNFSVDQARVMTFVPQKGTPMAAIKPADSLKEQIIIAVMRLVLGNVLIPASLDVDGLDGLKARLNAGANVVTSIVPPDKGLAGVANHSLDIEESRRTLDYIVPILKTCGLEPGLLEDYIAWTSDRQTRLSTPFFTEKYGADNHCHQR